MADETDYTSILIDLIERDIVSISIPEEVTRLRSYAFSGCTNLASVTIPSSVTSIGNRAFDGCTALAAINIPASVTSINSNAFTGCSSLANIYCGFSEGAVSGAPWGASSATVHYNSSGPEA